MSENKLTPFSQQLAYMQKGCLDADMAERLANVVKAVMETGKQGTVSLQLKIQLRKTKSGDQIQITPVASHKAPESPMGDTIMFPTADGDLLRDDPNQRSLDLKTVEVPAAAALKAL
ncbi:hypothetical protein [Zobellella sp. DQSA1]|uniref:hypothetical protein n=1 Tax=Zobellella sp. DQSA1 TaxID=3342386 RepID=UPI0035BFAD62